MNRQTYFPLFSIFAVMLKTVGLWFIPESNKYTSKYLMLKFTQMKPLAELCQICTATSVNVWTTEGALETSVDCVCTFVCACVWCLPCDLYVLYMPVK